MLKSFYGLMSPLSAIAGFIASIANPQSGAPLLLGAILFHMWSKEED